MARLPSERGEARGAVVAGYDDARDALCLEGAAYAFGHHARHDAHIVDEGLGDDRHVRGGRVVQALGSDMQGFVQVIHLAVACFAPLFAEVVVGGVRGEVAPHDLRPVNGIPDRTDPAQQEGQILRAQRIDD